MTTASAISARERVWMTLNHEQPDRPPLVIGVSNATSLKMRPYQKLKQLLAIDAPDRFLYDWPELGTAELDEATLQALGSDVRGVWDAHPVDHFREMQNRPPGTPCFDSWGIGQVEVTPDNWFPAIHPLASATTIAALEAYPWPNMDDPSRVAGVRQRASALRAEGQYAIMATPWLLFPLERAIALQGMQRFFVNLVEHRDFALALLEKTTALCKQLMSHFLRELGENVDLIKIGDDLGTQESLLMSPRMYRQLVKPFHADYIAFIKNNTQAKVFFHSDGDVFPLIPDLVEMGVDILNPIQTSAGKMANLADLKQYYGKQLTFCGGIDTHIILPFRSPGDVRQEVHRVRRALEPGGGYMVASVHTILDDVPPENILAMAQAATEVH